jgi:hypothetical protein
MLWIMKDKIVIFSFTIYTFSTMCAYIYFDVKMQDRKLIDNIFRFWCL